MANCKNSANTKLATAAKKVRITGTSIMSFILAFVIAFSLAACSASGNKGEEPWDIKSNPTADPVTIDQPITNNTDILAPVDEEDLPEDTFVNSYSTTTAVGYYGEVKNDNIPRQTPAVNSKKGTNATVGTDYPIYGTNYNGSDKDNIIEESSSLTATGTANAGGGGYTWMDADGSLHSGTRANPGEYSGIAQLYKHIAAFDNYHGNVDDNEYAVEKQVTISPRDYNSYSVTGIYAPRRRSYNH